MKPPYSLLALSFLLGATTCLTIAEEAEKISFRKTVKPILREKCAHCHNKKTLPGKVSFESAKQAFIQTREGQAVIVPGKPDRSLMILALESSVMHEKTMPQTGQRPTAEEIKTLRKWIAQGADWPTGLTGRIRPTFYPTE